MNAGILVVLIPLTVLSFATVVVLTIGVAVKKVLRNRRELEMRVNREAYREALVGDAGSPARRRAVARAAARDDNAREDLVDVVIALGLPAARRAADGLATADLLAVTRHDLRSGRPEWRGLGTLLLGVIGDATDVERLERILQHDDDVEVRQTAARGLRAIGTDDAARALIRALETGALPAARVLEQLAGAYAAPIMLQSLQLDRLAAIHGDLADGLGLAGYDPAVDAIAALLHAGDERERMKACRALSRLHRPEVVPLLVEALADPSSVVRAQGAKALASARSPSAVPALAKALADPAWWVRANSAEALRRSGAPGLAALRTAVTSRDRFARDRAREALAMVEASAARRQVAA